MDVLSLFNSGLWISSYCFTVVPDNIWGTTDRRLRVTRILSMSGGNHCLAQGSPTWCSRAPPTPGLAT